VADDAAPAVAGAVRHGGRAPRIGPAAQRVVADPEELRGLADPEQSHEPRIAVDAAIIRL
jgi:hypothetical protein